MKGNLKPSCFKSTIFVFFAEIVSPRSFKNAVTRSRISPYNLSLSLHVIIKSSAYLTTLVPVRTAKSRRRFSTGPAKRSGMFAIRSPLTAPSSPSRVMFANNGEITPPCGVPFSGMKVGIPKGRL